ncbi:putative Mitogen-activated protein kinase kinase 5 [Cocos nucifera]|uniref:Putative Mitogen-activated protein kinase kinase 5 n=1 Tax=Cocos nucifera TaxID=13894 RepID=A0A8K0MZC5_COCNU|nr:putative Mitogen-activated protein kinase kinase 5 [Cocos nucifera]
MYDHASDIQISLEYMDGSSLKGRHISSDPFITNVARQVLARLAYLHRQCIVHHDIKPSNLLINSAH